MSCEQCGTIELMLLGFVSLFLTVFQPKIASICMPERLDHIMLPCAYKAPPSPAPAAAETEPASKTKCPPVLIAHSHTLVRVGFIVIVFGRAEHNRFNTLPTLS